MIRILPENPTGGELLAATPSWLAAAWLLQLPRALPPPHTIACFQPQNKVSPPPPPPRGSWHLTWAGASLTRKPFSVSRAKGIVFPLGSSSDAWILVGSCLVPGAGGAGGSVREKAFWGRGSIKKKDQKVSTTKFWVQRRRPRILSEMASTQNPDKASTQKPDGSLQKPGGSSMDHPRIPTNRPESPPRGAAGAWDG